MQHYRISSQWIAFLPQDQTQVQGYIQFSVSQMVISQMLVNHRAISHKPDNVQVNSHVLINFEVFVN